MTAERDRLHCSSGWVKLTEEAPLLPLTARLFGLEKRITAFAGGRELYTPSLTSVPLIPEGRRWPRSSYNNKSYVDMCCTVSATSRFAGLTRSNASRSAHMCHPRPAGAAKAAAPAGTSACPSPPSLSAFHTAPPVEASNTVPPRPTQWRTTAASLPASPLLGLSGFLLLPLVVRSTAANATAEIPDVVRCQGQGQQHTGVQAGGFCLVMVRCVGVGGRALRIMCRAPCDIYVKHNTISRGGLRTGREIIYEGRSPEGARAKHPLLGYPWLLRVDEPQVVPPLGPCAAAGRTMATTLFQT